jgi:hypothetical protein
LLLLDNNPKYYPLKDRQQNNSARANNGREQKYNKKFCVDDSRDIGNRSAQNFSHTNFLGTANDV